MASEGRRTFKFLNEQLTEYKLNILCRKVAVDMMNCNDGHPRSRICEIYWITESAYYECMKRAVVQSLVSEEEMKKMEAKAIKNQQYNAETTGIRSKVKYEILKIQREGAIEDALKMSVVRKKNLTKKYSETKDTLFGLSMKESVPYSALGKIINEAIVNCYVDDDIVKKIQDKSLRMTNDRKKVIAQFTEYKKIREEKKKSEELQS